MQEDKQWGLLGVREIPRATGAGIGSRVRLLSRGDGFGVTGEPKPPRGPILSWGLDLCYDKENSMFSSAYLSLTV